MRTETSKRTITRLLCLFLSGCLIRYRWRMSLHFRHFSPLRKA
nr:MAG TPA: hypothetical protein [Caudoviricetes sp.]